MEFLSSTRYIMWLHFWLKITIIMIYKRDNLHFGLRTPTVFIGFYRIKEAYISSVNIFFFHYNFILSCLSHTLSHSLFHSLTFSLSLSLSRSLSFFIFIYLYLYISLSLYIFIFIYLSFSLFPLNFALLACS